MSNINKQKILQKVQLMDEYLAYLALLAKETKRDKNLFLADFHYFGAAERYLQLSIQTLVDIVGLIIIGENIKKPENSQEMISLLHGKKIISTGLAEQLDGIIGFRNILVHEYGKIDKERVYQYLQRRIGDLKKFKKEILKYCA